MTNESIKTACILCSRNCGLDVSIKDTAEGQVFNKIKGDPDHPLSEGYICQKAARLTHYQSHKDRLTHPLKRQPDGQFVEVSWDEALRDIATRLNTIRYQHGGDAFAFVGGGGQGNHMGAAYSRQLLAAMKSRFAYNALGQKKTGDFWVNGRLFGRQNCHTTEDVEHADYILFIGTNPFQAHGIPNARDTLSDHLYDEEFLTHKCTDWSELKPVLEAIPIEEYIAIADLDLKEVESVATGFAKAKRGCIRIDLGIQHSLHTTLNSYLEKLLYLVTGNFGKPGTNNLHTMMLPILGHTDERYGKKGKSLKRTTKHNMFPIAGIYPPNILPDEIEQDSPKRIRAVVVDSANPVLTYANSQANERSFASLELLVVIDVALTETARLADYVLPASSQYEKFEATGFNLEFPKQVFQLRRPVFKPTGNTLTEPEIYTRLLEYMDVIPREFPKLSAIARNEPKMTRHLSYITALGATLARNPQWVPHAASIIYRTLGPTLPYGAAAAAPLLPLCIQYAFEHYKAVKKAGHKGNRATISSALFDAILNQPSGAAISHHEWPDMWSFIKHKDKQIHIMIPEMISEITNLKSDDQKRSESNKDFPFILMAGERRSYNANQIYRDPSWRKVDKEGVMRMHPEDAKAFEFSKGATAICESANGSIQVIIEIDDTVRKGMVTLPHGYGLRYQDSAPIGPELNKLTSSDWCDPFSRTPFHKYVPVRITTAKVELEGSN
ncbi:molybdopterin-dependent oxidoreductase [Thalassolituus sp.]|uniref:molybdopterin-dependent oxidoreductase n=1 Tax=Thalassolituus sp. TaxID=2030822 RepID=UPI002A7F0A6A|nr:molybdopterin-dependent oxidoreductase [Thalassolituus sp.]